MIRKTIYEVWEATSIRNSVIFDDGGGCAISKN